MNTEKKPLLILTGPTAVGKTRLSIKLAKAVNGEIISADSMQVYKHMDVGSAKITPEEMDGVRHYLVDELEPFDEFHVVKFQEYAKRYLKEHPEVSAEIDKIVRDTLVVEPEPFEDTVIAKNEEDNE